MNATQPCPDGFSPGDNVAYPDNQILNLDPNLRDIYHWFGQETVLIPVPRGQALGHAWKQITVAQSRAPKHQAALWNSDVGIACGPQSQNLCAARFADQPDLDQFLVDNPALRSSLITRGPSGTLVWCRIEGFCPPARRFDAWEWLAAGSLAIVYARPPADSDYRCLQAARPLVLPFDQLVWPDPARGVFIQDTMEFRHGPPVIPSKAGQTINPYFITGFYAQQCRILYEPAHRAFYRFDPARNRYLVDHEERVMSELSSLLLSMSRNPGLKKVATDRSPQALRSLIRVLKMVAVGNLPGEQDALDRFWSQRVEKAPGSNLTTEELFGAYTTFCAEHGLPVYPEGQFQRLVPSEIRERFGVCKRHSLRRDQKTQRGFANIRLKT